MTHEMTIASISMDQSTRTPVLVLKSEKDGRLLPIWIGILEASSIVFGLQNTPIERPLTHDLFSQYLAQTATTVERVVVCDLVDNTYHARIVFAAGESRFELDSRPSDAIAMAVRFQAPIFVEDRVLDQSQKGTESVEVVDESHEGKRWADYLEGLAPEDFGKYKV
ncbi:bifunctional nuclease family protein [Desulfoluna sp.]|uniref:bifunctional nuclease family protein n=1 Tax=Desulfoluna sp. TaxID=2045199 RepID=UPI0026369D29|nr:bifunctional nuclease family protein [Desulfoluna sp.]